MATGSATFAFDADVPASDRTDIRDAIAIADVYFASAFGAPRIGAYSVVVRVAGPWEPGSEGACCYADGPRSRAIYFHVGHQHWSASPVGNGRNAHLKSTIHEYAHMWQGEQGGRGCMQQEGLGYVAPRWFIEGMAEHAAYEALSSRGLITAELVRSYFENTRRDKVVPLRSLEGSAWPSDGNPYGLAHAAAARMAALAGPRGVTAFCTDIGRGTRWDIAFERTFGLTVSAFYEGFGRWLATGSWD